jgi:hypothetical protein
MFFFFFFLGERFNNYVTIESDQSLSFSTSPLQLNAQFRSHNPHFEGEELPLNN